MASIFYLTAIFFLSLSNPITITASSPSNILAVFAFGDSTVDSGNNNNIPNSLYRADHPPYGRELPSHVPSGRFSNGKLPTDFLVHDLLNLKDLLPAYFHPKLSDVDLLSGVSFGSAGSGLDNFTVELNKVMGLSRQFELFEEVLKKMNKQVGERKARNIIQNAVLMIMLGLMT